jgi:hypothetical protein
MAGPAYMLWIANSWKEGWYKLSEEERKEIMKKCGEATKKFGGERLCSCKTPAGRPAFGIVKYPDMDSLEKSMAAHQEFDWPDKYIDVEHIAGIDF